MTLGLPKARKIPQQSLKQRKIIQVETVSLNITQKQVKWVALVHYVCKVQKQKIGYYNYTMLIIHMVTLRAEIFREKLKSILNYLHFKLYNFKKLLPLTLFSKFLFVL